MLGAGAEKIRRGKAELEECREAGSAESLRSLAAHDAIEARWKEDGRLRKEWNKSPDAIARRKRVVQKAAILGPIVYGTFLNGGDQSGIQLRPRFLAGYVMAWSEHWNNMCFDLGQEDLEVYAEQNMVTRPMIERRLSLPSALNESLD